MKKWECAAAALMAVTGVVCLVPYLTGGREYHDMALGMMWLCIAVAIYEDGRKREKKEKEDKQ